MKISLSLYARGMQTETRLFPFAARRLYSVCFDPMLLATILSKENIGELNEFNSNVRRESVMIHQQRCAGTRLSVVRDRFCNAWSQNQRSAWSAVTVGWHAVSVHIVFILFFFVYITWIQCSRRIFLLPTRCLSRLSCVEMSHRSVLPADVLTVPFQRQRLRVSRRFQKSLRIIWTSEWSYVCFCLHWQGFERKVAHWFLIPSSSLFHPVLSSCAMSEHNYI